MANKYLRGGASGSADGSDWTNAYTTVSALEGGLARGDVGYVVAGSAGAYGGAVFNTAVSGTTLITIKKATIADHGTSTGWSDSYASGQAVFADGWGFLSSYWLIDGVTGGISQGLPTSGYGFKWNETTSENFSVPDTNPSSQLTDITLKHFEIQGGGTGDSGNNDALATYPNGVTNFICEDGYIHDMARCPFLFTGTEDGSIFRRIVIGDFESTGPQHSEAASIWANVGNIVFEACVLMHAEGTGGFIWDNSGNTGATLKFNSCVFYRPSGDTWDGGNGAVGGWTGSGGEQFHNVTVDWCTFINLDIPPLGNLANTYSGNRASNNLFYNCDSPEHTRWATHNYNHYINSGGTHSEANGTSAASGDPFVNFAALDFRLKAPTTAAQTPTGIWTTDYLGRTRGAYNGTVSRGACDYVLEPPTGLGAT